MTFSLYQSLRSLPFELDEMATLYRLSKWERFTRLELPASAIGLVWNGMMSFGGGWFFLPPAKPSACSIANTPCPDLARMSRPPSRRAISALSAGPLPPWSILILLIDQFFWKPLVTIADRTSSN